MVNISISKLLVYERYYGRRVNSVSQDKMSSKLSQDQVKEAIKQVLEGSKTKKRNFIESVELQIGLKDYDTQKDKRFSGTVKLPNASKPNLNVN